MQRIPTLYGFSIIVLVLILMIINHIIYMEILERSISNKDLHTINVPQKSTVEEVPVAEDESVGIEEDVAETDEAEGSEGDPESEIEVGDEAELTEGAGETNEEGL